jgi:hypothetical protein
MVEIKGKYITLAGMLISDNHDLLNKANDYLQTQTGYLHWELPSEEFFDIVHLNEFLKLYSSVYTNPGEALKYFGKRIIPTIKRTTGIPSDIKSVLDYLNFEASDFINNYRGEDVIPRRITTQHEGEFTVYSPSPGYEPVITTGIYLGIFEMTNIKTARIKELGGYTYRIKW